MGGKGRKVRSLEVAALANASPSTVSRALSGDKRISEPTRLRVLAAAKQLDYHPNLIARSLKNDSTGIVGVVVTKLDNPYHAHMLKLLIDEMSGRNLAPLVFACNSRDHAGAAIAGLMSYQVDAVIGLAAPYDREIVRRCAERGKPLVLMNHYSGPEAVHATSGSSREGGALAAEHLIARGARRLAFFAGDDGARISAEREEGFRGRLAELGRQCVLRASSRYAYEEAFGAAAALLSERPDAVFCANDTLAFALMDRARRDFGVRIPDDMMVIGYDNSALASWASYDLTSIDQNLEIMVAAAVSTVQEIIGGTAGEPTLRQVQPRLAARGSTARAAT